MEVDSEDANHQVVPGSWRNEEGVTAWESLDALSGNTSSKAGKLQRDYMAEYHSSPAGAVSWQDRMVYAFGDED